MKKFSLSITFVLLVIAAITLSIAATLTLKLPGDLSIARWIQQHHTGDWIKHITTLVSWITEPEIVVFGALAGIILLIRRKWIQAFALGAVLLTVLPVSTIKQLIDRPRPSSDLVNVLATSDSQSYPSGHVFLAVIIFGSIIYFANQIFGPNQRVIWLARVTLFFGIPDIGLSRIYKGVHWPSDVLGSFLIGSLALWISIRVYERFAAPVIARVLVWVRLKNFAPEALAISTEASTSVLR